MTGYLPYCYTKDMLTVNAVSDTGQTALTAAARVWYSAAINVLLDSVR